MPIPDSYESRDDMNSCQYCDFCQTVNAQFYCRFGEKSVTAVFIEDAQAKSKRSVEDLIGHTRVNPNGVCNHFESTEP